MNKIRLGIINSNFVGIGPFAKKGTEIFDFVLATGLDRYKRKEISFTNFCSENSQIPGKKESVSHYSSTEDKNVGEKNYLIFELALIAKAIGMQNKFDIFHVNLGCGEHILPFAKYIRKPVIITMHGNTYAPHLNKYFSLYKNLKNIYFTPISNSQKKPIPFLNYTKTIYHGIEAFRKYKFGAEGGKSIIWTGRAAPEKGLDIVFAITKKTKKSTKMFPIIKEEYIHWLHEEVIKKKELLAQIIKLDIDFNTNRFKLIKEYQNSKLFLFPLQWEEPFGLTLIESMACGTPVVAYARGSILEIVKDGVTGFVVNSSDSDIRGNWIIKKTGIEGLCEAIAKIYTMPKEEYMNMRRECRIHVEKNFTVEHMVDQYVEVYKEILAKNSHK